MHTVQCNYYKMPQVRGGILGKLFQKWICTVPLLWALMQSVSWTGKTISLLEWQATLRVQYYTTYWYIYSHAKNASGFHRRTGSFLPGEAVNHLPKKSLQVAQIFTKQSNRNEGRCNNIGRTGIWKWLDTVFQGQYLPSLSINYVAINKVLEKLPPQLY